MSGPFGLDLLAPLGLAALVGIPAVILFHMRHTTPQTRPVPTLRFWRAAMLDESEQTAFRRPPLSLLLLLHLLIVALLAFGLTRPATSGAWAASGLGLRTEPRHEILLLDGSTSMAAIDTPSGETRFEAARRIALDRLDDLREGDVATVVLMGTRVATLEATDAGGFVALSDRLRAIAPPGGRAGLNAALNLTKDLLLPSLDDRVVLVSDGALAVDPGLAAGLGAPVELVTVGGETGTVPIDGNVAITELAASAAPGDPARQQLFVRVANFSPEPVTVPVTLTAGGIEALREDVTIAPGGGSERLDWEAPTGAAEVTVAVAVDDPLPDDDAASLILRQDTDLTLQILLVSDAPRHLRRALAVLPGAEVTTQPTDGPLAGGDTAAYDLIVYDNAVPDADQLAVLPANAALLLVHPPAGGPIATRGEMVAPTLTTLVAYDPLLEGVDLSGVTFGQTPVYEIDATQTEVVGAEAGPLIFRGPLGGKDAVVIGFDPNASNIVQRPVFPILIANVAAQLAPSPLPASVPLGEPLVYRPRIGAAVARVAPPEGEPTDLSVAAGDPDDTSTDPATAGADRLRSVAYADTGRPGVYRVTELDAGGEPLGGGRFVVNAGHPTESDLRPNPDLAAALATAQAGSDAGAAATLADLWPPLVAAALLILALEWLVTAWPRRRMALAPAPRATPLPVRGRGD